MSDSGCAQRDDLAAYALGAVDPRRAEELERHLADCDQCRQELRWLEPAVEVLPESVPQVEPSGELRERLLQSVREDAVPEPRRAAESGAGNAPSGRLEFARRWMLRPATGIAAAGIAAAGIAGYALNDDGEGTSVYPVNSAAPSTSATLEVDEGSATLQVLGMEKPEPGSVYQVWVQAGDEIRPSSLLMPRADGAAAATVPEVLEDADGVMVTEESSEGRARPTSPPLLTASID